MSHQIFDQYGEAEILQHVQTVYRTHLPSKIESLNTLWGDGVDLASPVSADIQVGPEYNFGGDPVLGIEWRSTTGTPPPEGRWFSGRQDEQIHLSIFLAFFSSDGLGNVALRQARYARAVWLALWTGFRGSKITTCPSLIDVRFAGARPLSARNDQIDGYATEISVTALAQFTLPTL